MRYLRNCWYMAAWTDELPVGAILSRRFLDDPVVLFRNSEGEVKALFDRCPHRFVPLSKGAVTDGLLHCGYHGLAFDGTGACAINPHGPVLKNMAVRSFPTVEAFRAIWIWMGDPALADRTALRDLGFADETPETAFSSGYVCGNGNYQLFVDNILDLTHADFLHPTTLGGGAFTRTRANVIETDDRLAIHWHCMNEVPSPMMAATFKDGNQRVDSWTEVEWSAPAVMTLCSGAVPAGTPREAGGNVLNLHITTPETSDRTHYFFASTRDFAQEDAALNARIAETRNHIFATEDKPMIDAQQERMGGKNFWEMNPILLRIDEGAVRVRRKLAEMIKAEGATAAAEAEHP